MKEEINVLIKEDEIVARVKDFLPANWQNILQCRLRLIL